MNVMSCWKSNLEFELCEKRCLVYILKQASQVEVVPKVCFQCI